MVKDKKFYKLIRICLFMALNEFLKGSKEHYVPTFMGKDYPITRPTTIGELKEVLEMIREDLPTDNSLRLKVYLDEGKLCYTLRDGIVQEAD